MSHVDDGLLEAWLDRDRSGISPDGVRIVERHLAACPECRERLAEAGRLRDRAAAILAGTGPSDVVAPAFEEIAARAGGSSKPIASPALPYRTNRRRFIAAAWAASFIGALGLGWLARESMRTDQIALLESTADVVLVREEERPAVARGGAPVPAVESLDAPVSNLPPPPSSAGSMASTAEPVVADASGSTTVDPPVPGTAIALNESPASTGAAPPAPPAADAPVAYQAGQDRPDIEAARAETQPASARVADSAAPTAAAARAAASAPLSDESVAAMRVAPATPDAWITADLAQAERRLGSPPISIPGLAIDRVELHSDADVRRIRVFHTLDDGSTLVLSQWHVEEDVTLQPAGQTAGTNTVTIRRGDLIVSATSAIDVTRLESLIPPPP